MLLAPAMVAAGTLVIWRLGSVGAAGSAAANRLSPPVGADRLAPVAETQFPSTAGALSLAAARGSQLVLLFYSGAT